MKTTDELETAFVEWLIKDGRTRDPQAAREAFYGGFGAGLDKAQQILNDVYKTACVRTDGVPQ